MILTQVNRQNGEIESSEIDVEAGSIIAKSIENMEIKEINISDIFSETEVLDSIEELADDIYDAGVLIPPIVKEENGIYKIVAGERRLAACQLLIQEKRWPEDKKIRCSIFDPNLIEVDLSPELKELYVKLSDNS